jgi:hypothetical protein
MQRAQVELRVFSGRVNPRWDMPFEQAMRLYNEAALLPEMAQKDLVEGLGYNGFVIFIQSDNDRIVCTVLSDLVKIEKARERIFKKDHEKKIETKLLGSAKENIDSQLYMIVENEVKRHR